MELDDFKTIWKEQAARLDSSMRLNEMLVRQSNARRAESSLARLGRSLTIELVLLFAVVVALGWFAANYVAQPAIAACAAILGVYALAIANGEIRQLVMLREIDFDEPVLVTVRKLERTRLVRIRTTAWALLFGPIMWVPMGAVLLRVSFGIDAFAVLSPAYIAANVLLGLLVIPLAIWISRRYAGRLRGSRFVQALAREIAGANLREALEYLDTIDRFESPS